MPLRQSRPFTEDALPQSLPRLVALTHPPTTTQLRHDELAEVAGRVEGVVLPQVDAVDAVVIEPALDRIGDLLRGPDREETRVPRLVDATCELLDGQVQRKPA